MSAAWWLVGCGGPVEAIPGAVGDAGEASGGGRTGNAGVGGQAQAGRGSSGGRGGGFSGEPAGGSTIGGGAGIAGSPLGGSSQGGVPTPGGSSGSPPISGEGGGGSGGTDEPQGGSGGVCREGVSEGGRLDENQCPVPWWGEHLYPAVGLLDCPEPYDPAMLAYAQTNQPRCFEITGPIAKATSSEGQLQCCYHVDQTACCNSTYEGDFCVDVPYFGDGGTTVVPVVAIDALEQACAEVPLTYAAKPLVEAAASLVGTWFACNELQVPFLGSAFVFRADGSFHSLTLGSDGVLGESEGCLQGGLWGFLGSTGQLNLHMEDFSQYHHPEFAGDPADHLMIYGHAFVRVPEG